MIENSLDNNPCLKQNRVEVEKQPKIAEYLKIDHELRLKNRTDVHL
jgi:hypothetical protein